MLKQLPERITYAQQKIIKLIEDRKLRKWCLENNLIHSTVYKFGTGEKLPSYPIVKTMSHLIAPIEWLFYTDEELPYKPKTVLPLDDKTECKFIAENKKKFREIAKKYNLTELQAYNIMIGRKNPNLNFIRLTTKDFDPIVFFIPSEKADIGIPDRNDIICIFAKKYLVLTTKNTNKNNTSIIACEIIPEKTNIELLVESKLLPDSEIHGYVKSSEISTFSTDEDIVILGKATKETTEAATSEIINFIKGE